MNKSTVGRVRPQAGSPARHVRGAGRLRLGALVLLTALSAVAAQAGSVSYTYDVLGRLAKATYNNGTTTTTISYSYDAVGNRTSVATTSP